MQFDNANELPYYIIESGHPVQVHFVPLGADDDKHINDRWPSSIYFVLWQQLAQHEVTRQTTLKLATVDKLDDLILGLLRMRADEPYPVFSGKLNTQSVLETMPHLRYQVKERDCKGIGKVLVARLIAESVQRGHEGALIVSPRPQALPFYRHLGFMPFKRDPKLLYVRGNAGKQILRSVLLGSEIL